MRIVFGQCFTDAHRDTDWTRRMRRLAEAFARADHEVVVCCGRWWEGRASERYRNGVRYRAVTETPAPDAFSLRLPATIVRADPDVIHVTGAEPWTVLAARIGGFLRRAPVVSEWYGTIPDFPTDPGWADRLAIRVPSRLLTPSRYIETTVRGHGATDDRTTVIPESINFSLVERLEAVGDAEIVYASHLDEQANVEPVLLALAELRDRDWRAAIIGDGPERARLVREAADLRIGDRVAFPGTLALPERVGRYKRANVFVQTATRCPFATELCWALAAGCVGVVAYQSASAAHELVEGHPRGIRVTDDSALQGAIAEAATMDHRTLDRAFERYDHERIRERYLALYETVSEEYGLL